MVAIELSDFVFAVDSIPAVIGVSNDIMVVYSSNIFAIMGLRSLYTVVAAGLNGAWKLDLDVVGFSRTKKHTKKIFC